MFFFRIENKLNLNFQIFPFFLLQLLMRITSKLPHTILWALNTGNTWDLCDFYIQKICWRISLHLILFAFILPHFLFNTWNSIEIYMSIDSLTLSDRWLTFTRFIKQNMATNYLVYFKYFSKLCLIVLTDIINCKIENRPLALVNYTARTHTNTKENKLCQKQREEDYKAYCHLLIVILLWIYYEFIIIYSASTK